MSDQEKCRRSIEQYLKCGSNLQINGEYAFRWKHGCGSKEIFDGTMKEHYPNKTVKNAGKTVGLAVRMAGGILTGTGYFLTAMGNLIMGIEEEVKDCIVIS